MSRLLQNRLMPTNCSAQRMMMMRGGQLRSITATTTTSFFRRVATPSARALLISPPPSPAGPKLGLQWAPRRHGGAAPIRRFCGVRASQGPIGSPMMQDMENKIKEHLNAELVTVKDANGDGRHVSIEVVSSEFEGKSAVNRQRMVYKAIWEELQSTVHAVDQMTTRTPAEAAASSSQGLD